MHKLASLLVLLGMCLLPALAANQTFKDVSLIDSNCSKKAAADPDSHTRDCALKCEKTGYAIVTSDGTVLKLDEKGNQEAAASLKASSKADHLRATVTGDRDGYTLKVKSLKM